MLVILYNSYKIVSIKIGSPKEIDTCEGLKQLYSLDQCYKNVTGIEKNYSHFQIIRNLCSDFTCKYMYLLKNIFKLKSLFKWMVISIIILLLFVGSLQPAPRQSAMGCSSHPPLTVYLWRAHWQRLWSGKTMSNIAW